LRSWEVGGDTKLSGRYAHRLVIGRPPQPKEPGKKKKKKRSDGGGKMHTKKQPRATRRETTKTGKKG